ncbi:hypothetical protein INT43_005411 [Umbelopsis isabellina]|uniref:Uncharacterized protein n=1 Tax=Mortierella isabellina TaxID=91625 RepID=A0A8H7PLG5_MORIS|nr:hypothetical protein INT43_005411 [Umbelopsis isabellina]
MLCGPVSVEVAYIELLNGYPVDHFVITDAVKHTKRPDCMVFHSPQDFQTVWLKVWLTSWKQRVVFVLHVLSVQRQVVNVAHQKTQVFMPELTVSLHDSDYISRMEEYVGAKWKEAIHIIHFTEFNIGGTDQQRLARIPNLSNTILGYFNRLKSICFSMPATMQQTSGIGRLYGRDYLSLVLDIDSSLQDQARPPILIHPEYENEARDHRYEYGCIAESFTDYLIPYVAVIIRLGYLPQGEFGEVVGYGDLVSPLPRFPGLPQSILLTQHEGWSVANYSPIYINPPCLMIGGFQDAWWKPYSVPEALQRGSFPKSFNELEGKEMPKPKSRQITVEIYHTMQQMIDTWIESAVTPVQATKKGDAETLQKVRQRISQIMGLFEKFQARFLAWLYYANLHQGYRYLYDYINLTDHLRALENGSYKYSVDELHTVEKELRSHLNVMHLYSVKTTRSQYGYDIELSGIAQLPIDWSRV